MPHCYRNERHLQVANRLLQSSRQRFWQDTTFRPHWWFINNPMVPANHTLDCHFLSGILIVHRWFHKCSANMSSADILFLWVFGKIILFFNATNTDLVISVVGFIIIIAITNINSTESIYKRIILNLSHLPWVLRNIFFSSAIYTDLVVIVVIIILKSLAILGTIKNIKIIILNFFQQPWVSGKYILFLMLILSLLLLLLTLWLLQLLAILEAIKNYKTIFLKMKE